MDRTRTKAGQSNHSVAQDVRIIEQREAFADYVANYFLSATSIFDLALYHLERGDCDIKSDFTPVVTYEQSDEMLRDFTTWKEVANHCAEHLSALRTPYYLLIGEEKDESLWKRPDVYLNARLYFDAMIEDLEHWYLRNQHQPNAYNFAEEWRNSGLSFDDLID